MTTGLMTLFKQINLNFKKLLRKVLRFFAKQFEEEENKETICNLLFLKIYTYFFFCEKLVTNKTKKNKKYKENKSDLTLPVIIFLI